ncbi:hypothetical protein ACMWJ6_15945, partial [Escherichia coli]
VRLVILVGLAIDQIAQSGLSSLSVIYYSAQLFSSTGKDVVLLLFTYDIFISSSPSRVIKLITIVG